MPPNYRSATALHEPPYAGADAPLPPADARTLGAMLSRCVAQLEAYVPTVEQQRQHTYLLSISRQLMASLSANGSNEAAWLGLHREITGLCHATEELVAPGPVQEGDLMGVRGTRGLGALGGGSTLTDDEARKRRWVYLMGGLGVVLVLWGLLSQDRAPRRRKGQIGDTPRGMFPGALSPR